MFYRMFYFTCDRSLQAQILKSPTLRVLHTEKRQRQPAGDVFRLTHVATKKEYRLPVLSPKYTPTRCRIVLGVFMKYLQKERKVTHVPSIYQVTFVNRK